MKTDPNKVSNHKTSKYIVKYKILDRARLFLQKNLSY